MKLTGHYKKFKKHFKDKGLFYSLWRGLKYFILITKPHYNSDSSSLDMINSSKLKIICSNNGINILWDGCQITKGVGLNVAINTLGMWTDSSKADWQVLKKEQGYLKIRVVFRDLPLNQIWQINLTDERSIDWQVNMEVEEWLWVDEFRIICFVDQCYKTWMSDYKQSDFSRLDNKWHDIYIDNGFVSLVGVRFPVEDKNLPSFMLETKDKQLFPLIQNPPLDNAARLIGFRDIKPEEKKPYPPGESSLFTGRINIVEDNYFLDAKIERLRKDYFNVVINKKTNAGKRKLNILLVNLPWQKGQKWGVRAGSRWPHIKDESENGYLPFPFFLSYAAALLRKNDIKASLIDAIAGQIPVNEFIGNISNMNFDYLVAETSVPSFSYDLSLLEKISKSGISIILCGPNSEIYQPEFLKQHPFIDFVLQGEYEFTLLELIQNLQDGRHLSKVKGLIYNDGGTIRKNLSRAPFDINLLSWPQRDELPMEKYLDAPGEMMTPSVQMVASRGCPFNCQFCLWPQILYQGNHYRARDTGDVINEMEYLVKNKGFKSVYFDDDTFNIGKQRMLNLCRKIRERNLEKIQWAIMARPDLMDEEILENMKKAGLWAVKYGVESADQGLVDSIGKRMDLRKTEKMIRFTQDLGIKVHLTFTFGLPGETKQSIEKTIKYALKLKPFSVQFSITTPFPGTLYYDTLDKQGLIVSKDFSLYDGHSKSVIRLDNLAPEDLEEAKERAYLAWERYSKKNRPLKENIKKFYGCVKEKGISCAFNKAKKYFCQKV